MLQGICNPVTNTVNKYLKRRQIFKAGFGSRVVPGKDDGINNERKNLHCHLLSDNRMLSGLTEKFLQFFFLED
jgi:hypothetical protein